MVLNPGLNFKKSLVSVKPFEMNKEYIMNSKIIFGGKLKGSN